ncbi:MAG: DUF1846 domain-containing protein [Clostridia bacterium]|nr:DUF1846 domain-containing protein [Clostridia bacterium]
MQRTAFNNEKYIELQSAQIRKRLSLFGDKLYLEFGGKLFDDFHASRVMPGFKPDSKINMLLQLKDQAEVVIVINATDIEKNKVRGDLGITYDLDLLRLIDAFREKGLYVPSVVITRFAEQPVAVAFIDRLRALGLKVYRHYTIEGYPSDIANIVSEHGFGRNEYVETTRQLVVVTAPGPGSGKMATCLSQLYHENKRGIKAGYAKFETFPIWNLPLNHPINLAYEAATADLNDINMIDPFHLEAYGQTTVNYNRDVEIYPVLNAILERILGTSPYASPTDMGVNMAGYCIEDDEAACSAARSEIIRRYYTALCAEKQGLGTSSEANKINSIMKRANTSPADRPVIRAALDRETETGEPAAALQLPDGTIVTGRTTNLMGACAALLLNALKKLAGIEDEIHLISPRIIEPLQDLKVNHMGSKNPRLHTDEVLIALSICASTDPKAEECMAQLQQLSGCQAHSSVILAHVDSNMFSKLGIQLTCEPKYETEKLYHK